MFKSPFRKLIPLLLALALLISALTACDFTKTPPEDSEDDAPADSDGNKQEDEAPDPAKLLDSALTVTGADLDARFAASPLPALISALDGDTHTAVFDITPYDDEGNVLTSTAGGGTLIIDSASLSAWLDFTQQETDVDLKLRYTPEFMGFTSDKLIGDGVYYGLRPSGLAQQLEGTELAELIELDMDQVRQLDSALAGMSDPLPDIRAIFQAEKEAVNEFLRSRSYILSPMAETGGDGADYSLLTTVSASSFAQFLTQLIDIMPDMGLIYGAASEDGGGLTIREAVDEMGVSGSPVTLTLELVDGRLNSVRAGYMVSGEEREFIVSLYGGSGNLIKADMIPHLSMALELGERADFTLFTYYGEGCTITFSLDSQGALSFISYSADVTRFTTEGTFTSDGTGARYSGFWSTGNRGDRTDISLTLTPGGTVPSPGEAGTKSLAEMSRAELYKILIAAVMKLKLQ